MKWTKKKPTEPGYYWMKYVPEHPYPQTFICEITELGVILTLGYGETNNHALLMWSERIEVPQ